MDAEHRHELRENELAKFLRNLPDFVRKHWAAIIGWACIIAAIVLWAPIKEWRAASDYEEMAEVTNLIQRVEGEKSNAAYAENGGTAIMSAGALEDTADETDNDSLSAMALIKSAEALRADVHYTEMGREAILDQIGKAKELYEGALARANDDPVMAAMAKYNIGLCAEEVGDFDQAETIYNEIAENEAFGATVYPRLAQTRLNFMQDYQREFTFEVVPEEEPAEEGESVEDQAGEGAAVGETEQAEADEAGADGEGQQDNTQQNESADGAEAESK